jgi:hypothetical protein
MAEIENQARLKLWGTSVPLLVLAYLFALGPLFWLDERGLLGSDNGPVWTAVSIAYTPVLWISGEFDAFHKVLYWYVDLWTTQ